MARKNKTLGMAGAAAVGVLILLLVGTKQDHFQTSVSNGAEQSARTPDSLDCMSVELRAKVNELKADVVREPTTRSTATERADVLWQWANAYALTGGVIPNDLPLVIRVARTSQRQVKGLSWAAKAIDNYVRELDVKDENPRALGTLRLDRDEPVVAESWQTIVQTYTVGEMPMAEGGAVYLGRDGFNNQGAPQVDDPAGDNYFTIRSSNPNSRFVYKGRGNRQSLVTRIHGIFQLEGAPLTEGDTITMTYGDRSDGSRGCQMQGYSVSQCTFPVYLDLEGKGNFFQPRWPAIEVIGKRKVAAVTGFVPSVVATGEPFDVSVRSEDNLTNRATGAIPEYQVFLNGKPYDRIPAGANAITVLRDVEIGEPGVYRFSFHSSDGKVTGMSNPVLVQKNPPHRIYWGETHGHIAYADGQGTPDGYFRFAQDDARLDFVTLSEHGLWLDDFEWKTLQEAVPKYLEPGKFTPILGYEWTVSRPQGHHNVLLREPASPRVASQDAPVLDTLYRMLRRRFRAEDVISIPHAHQPGNWEISDTEIERLIEITSTHGTFEWFGNRYLQQGWEVGFIGSSDNHHEHPGYTDTGTTFHTQRGGLAAVIAQENTTDTIFDALRNIKAYATGGKRIILHATLNGQPMGTRLDDSAKRRFHCRVMGTAPIDAVDVIKNGRLAYRRDYIAKDVQPHCWVRVAFESSSEVAGYRTPREYRVWQGTLDIQGAKLVKAEPQTLENRYFERVVRDPERPNRVSFFIMTRGRQDAIVLELEGASPQTVVNARLRLKAGLGPRFPGRSIDTNLSLGDTQRGSVRREFVPRATQAAAANKKAPGSPRIVDTLSLKLFDPEDSFDQEFEYVDLSEHTPGDYFYIRVTQIDGELAWSSPWWVGGSRRQPADHSEE